jgi:putative membrane protein
MDHWLTGVGPFFVYFALALLLEFLFVLAYTAITPYREIALIRAGNVAAATTLAGSLIGFSLPLAKSVAQSSSLVDMLLWSVLGFIAQLLAYGAVRVTLPQLVADVKEGKQASAVLLAGVAVAIGLVNAAAMTV